jgi:hypothetical protein
MILLFLTSHLCRVISNAYLWSPTGIIVEFFLLEHRLRLNVDVSISCITPASNMTMPFVTAEMQIEQTSYVFLHSKTGGVS